MVWRSEERVYEENCQSGDGWVLKLEELGKKKIITFLVDPELCPSCHFHDLTGCC